MYSTSISALYHTYKHWGKVRLGGGEFDLDILGALITVNPIITTHWWMITNSGYGGRSPLNLGFYT